MNWLRSDAIEGADVMLYGVSLAYKESSNCRLEANYAHQQELDMCALYSPLPYSVLSTLTSTNAQDTTDDDEGLQR